MEGKERGHERAPPERARGPAQQQEEEHAIQRVECQAAPVVCSGIHPEELDVEHVREPGRRVPVAGLQRREGPPRAFQGQPGLHARVLAHVQVVVVAHEVASPDRGECRTGRDDQQNRDGDLAVHRSLH
jgi:hypothetical protein